MEHGKSRPKYSAATIAFYGPDDKRASKVVVGIVVREGAEPGGSWGKPNFVSGSVSLNRAESRLTLQVAGLVA